MDNVVNNTTITEVGRGGIFEKIEKPNKNRTYFFLNN